MASTSEQDEAFAKAAGLSTVLDTAIDWINANMDPEEVFDESKLKGWAEGQGYTK